MDYERNYMADFASSDNAVVVAAFDGEEMVGAATAAPLMECHREFAPLFESFGYNPYRVFYFGESLLSPQYRGQGLGHKFFDGREAAARATPDMELCAFCAVLRSADHPLRPEGYSPLHSFWQKRGYRRVQDMVGRLSWRDLGEERETEKDMQFWVKAL